ncbi:MAG TPA: hypothetical protein PKY82_11275 [Pyrinomonadaceae bacterium]|nr:hypothetical protein [Pyrinomonadaceae bacterium]
MIENREKEWQELEQKASQILNNPTLLPKDAINKHFDPTLHLWISPTFTPEKHWVFYQPQPQINPQSQPIVRQIIWQRDADFQRLNNPLVGLQQGFQAEPAFEIKTIEIEREFFRKIHTQLSKIQLLPFIQEEIGGRDGEIFGIETLGFYHNAKISWWSEYPEEWKELADWYEKIKTLLEEKLNK